MHLDCKLVDDYMEQIIYGALQVCNAYSTNNNFMVYYRYGNHKSVDTNKAEFLKL